MVAQSIRTIKIFYCYAQEDEALQEELARHLSPFRRLRYITEWYNRNIQAGTDWEEESRTHLDAANIILLLLSANFFASDYHYAVEMEQAMRKHNAGLARVIPILLRPVAWKETPVGELSTLPANEKPITKWANRDEAWLQVVEGIREVIRDLLQKQPLSSEENDVLYPEQGPLSGQIIGNKYLLGELLGEGAFSQIYKAQHIKVQRQQAVKVLHEHYFRKKEFHNRFFREAQTMASLEHSHIIHLDDFGTEASRAYLVMPFISGGTLQGVLDKQQGFLEQHQIVFYLECICAALDYAHGKGIVHLDLKPLNLLVHEDGRLLLSDFGLAHLMKQGAMEGGSSLRAGTPHYMAPEHINGSPEKRSDLFSLGVILYQMLVGQLPFDGLSQETVLVKNITVQPPAPRSVRLELPQSIENVLLRAIAKQPAQRYQTANELLIALKNILVPSPQAPRPRTVLTPIPQEDKEMTPLETARPSTGPTPQLKDATQVPHVQPQFPAPQDPQSASRFAQLISPIPPVSSTPIEEMETHTLELENPATPRAGMGAPDPSALDDDEGLAPPVTPRQGSAQEDLFTLPTRPESPARGPESRRVPTPLLLTQPASMPRPSGKMPTASAQGSQTRSGSRDPRAAEPLIASLTTDKDRRVRQQAAEALGNLRNPQAVEPLIAALKDGHEWVRHLAAEALGKLGDSRAIEPLIAILGDKYTHVQEAASSALRKLGGPRIVEPLIAALTNKDAKVRAAQILGKLGDLRAVEPLIAVLADNDYEVRGEIVCALGKLGDLGAVEPLIAALADERMWVRGQAIEALGKLGDPRAIEPLIVGLKEDWFYGYNDDYLEDVGNVLAKLATCEPLIAVLTVKKSWVRSCAAKTLGKLKDTRAVEPLMALLQDEDWDVRKQAVWALKEMKDLRL